MARIKLAKSAGFCMGVRRAMNMTLEATMKTEGPIYTYGPLIHNPQVLEILEDKGVLTLNEENWVADLKDLKGKDTITVIIRAHGVTPEEQQKIKDLGVRILNATCPHVGKVQGIIRQHARNGYATVILGEKDHAEVIGLLGYTEGNGHVINSLEELKALPSLDKVCFVAQTTQDRNKFEEFAKAIRGKFRNVEVFNTVCESTQRRQLEVQNLARRVDAMVVVGGKGSGNTRRLTKISEEAGIPTFHVETEKELGPLQLARFSTIGITAGASTPTWLILKVVERIKGVQGKRGVSYYLERLACLMAISYVLLAIGAASLTYASALIQGLAPKPDWIFISSFYIFSMHTLNRLLNQTSEGYNQPGRMEFYQSHKTLMTILGILASCFAAFLAWFEGVLPFIMILAISGLGLIYNVRIFPTFSGKRKDNYRLRDIPGSKTIFISLAWGVVISLLPSLGPDGRISPATVIAFFVTTVLVFARCTLYDFKDIQGDLLVGKETIPIVLGLKKTENIVFSFVLIAAGVLILASLFEWASSIAPVFLISVIYVLAYFWFYRRRALGQGFLFEWVVDGSLIITGFLALLADLTF